MLPGEHTIVFNNGMVAFNSFWDATSSPRNFTPPSSLLSIPFGMLLGDLTWILLGNVPGFQFLLGCYLRAVWKKCPKGGSTFNSFWDATRWAWAARPRPTPLSIPFGMLHIIWKIWESKSYKHFQFLLGCYGEERRGYQRRSYAFNSFWDATIRRRLLRHLGIFPLSIPFGMLRWFRAAASSPSSTTFNSFWDAT